MRALAYAKSGVPAGVPGIWPNGRPAAAETEKSLMTKAGDRATWPFRRTGSPRPARRRSLAGHRPARSVNRQMARAMIVAAPGRLQGFVLNRLLAGAARLAPTRWTSRRQTRKWRRAPTQVIGRQSNWRDHHQPVGARFGAPRFAGRPSICRTCAFGRSLGNRSNFSVSGSKRRMALVDHSVSHTLSRSST